MNLLWFNLATDAGDPLLGFATGWIRSAARHVNRIDVVSMRVGRFDLPDNVRVFSAGKERGYGEPRRAMEFYRIVARLVRIHRYDACFAHMIPVFAAMASPLLRARRVPITLWYTHKAVTPILRLAERAAAHIVTASAESFPLSSSKLTPIGHGIDTDLFRPALADPAREGLLTVAGVGRISPVKRLELILDGVTRFVDSHAHPAARIRFVGPILDEAYATLLRRQAERLGRGCELEFTGEVPYLEMPAIYQSSDVVVSATGRGSFDKAPLEAMSCGVPAIVANGALHETFGSADLPTLHSIADPEELASSLAILAATPPEARRAHATRLRAAVVEHHGLRRLMPRLLHIMSGDPTGSSKRCRG